MKKKLKLEVLKKGRTLTEVRPADLQQAGAAAQAPVGDGGDSGGGIGCGGPAVCFT